MTDLRPPSIDAPGADFRLTPPDPIEPQAATRSESLVTLKPDRTQWIAAKADAFVEALLAADLHGEDFKRRLDQVFALGREEIALTAGLLQARPMARNFTDAASTPAYQAISGLREQMDALDPGKAGNLLEANRLLGFIPWGNKLQAYFRRYESAGAHIKACMMQLYAARDDLQRELIDIDAQRARLWSGMEKLAEAVEFARGLDAKVAGRIQALKAGDPQRAEALEQEVLFHLRQNLVDLLTQQAVSINGYLALDVVKKTGRELMKGCTRVATTGMSALAVAQMVARATGTQMRVMEMLDAVGGSVDALAARNEEQLGHLVASTAEIAKDPARGVAQITHMFDQAHRAMDALETFRGEAHAVMERNTAAVQAELERAPPRL